MLYKRVDLENKLFKALYFLISFAVYISQLHFFC